MLTRFLIVGLAVGTLAMPVGARADDAAAVVGGLIVGGLVGAAIATSVPQQHHEPLRQYIVQENRPSYVYEDEIAVGREFRPRGHYESYPVPDRYGVQGYHYSVANGRGVVYHPQTRVIVHHY